MINNLRQKKEQTLHETFNGTKFTPYPPAVQYYLKQKMYKV